MILIGSADVSKSQTVRNSLGDHVCWIEGNATAFGIYTALFHHLDQLVVVDDIDSLYSNAQEEYSLVYDCKRRQGASYIPSQGSRG